MVLRILLARGVAGGLSLLVGGCLGAVHQLPRIEHADILAARADARQAEQQPERPRLSEAEARRKLDDALARVRAAGEEVCHEMAIGSCTWRFVYARRQSLNASASIDGVVTMNHGLAEKARSEEEVCLVLAHEMGHLAADHVRSLHLFHGWGRSVGWYLGHVADTIADLSGRPRTNFTWYGESYGKWVGNLLFTRQREREADYLAVLIAYRAGIDLDRARGLDLDDARRMRVLASSVFDSHPRGAERLAGFDLAVAEVRATRGRLPPRQPWFARPTGDAVP